MKTPAYRGLVPLGAILIVAATTTIADARIGGLNMNSPISHSMTTTLDPGKSRGYPSWGNAPPPAVYNGPHWTRHTDDGGGGTGGFSPGGGSGTVPKKKPNQQ